MIKGALISALRWVFIVSVEFLLFEQIFETNQDFFSILKNKCLFVSPQITTERQHDLHIITESV